jgi:hypothetical protein
MRRPLAALAFLLALAPPLPAQEKPVHAAYYYKVRWGFQAEFEALFFKNHYPVLAAQMGEGGRLRAVHVYRPTYHGDGRADWTFLVVIVYRDRLAFTEPSREEEIARRLFPDQETFRKEEQRRFEVLDAHWDVPLTEVDVKR